jgi:hypothetical protein
MRSYGDLGSPPNVVESSLRFSDGTLESTRIVLGFRSYRHDNESIADPLIQCSPWRSTSTRPQLAQLCSLNLAAVRIGELSADHLKLFKGVEHRPQLIWREGC